MDRWQRKSPRACYTALTDILFDTLLHEYHAGDSIGDPQRLSNDDSLIKPALFAAPNPLCMAYIFCMIPSSLLGVNSVQYCYTYNEVCLRTAGLCVVQCTTSRFGDGAV